MIVFDIDGTLADPSHRLHLVQREEPQWDEFFLACDADLPIEPVLGVAAAMESYYDAPEVQYWTGRSRIAEDLTVNWLRANLARHGVTTGDPPTVLMREPGDHRPDHELKREWLYDLRRQGRHIDLVFEDRPRVVEMWRREGVTCMHVGGGDF